MAEVMKMIPKTYDLLAWMLPVVSKFPRDQKHLLGDRMQSGLMDIMGTLIEANYARDRGALPHKGGKPWKPKTNQPARGAVSSLCKYGSETVSHGRRTGS